MGVQGWATCTKSGPWTSSVPGSRWGRTRSPRPSLLPIHGEVFTVVQAYPLGCGDGLLDSPPGSPPAVTPDQGGRTGYRPGDPFPLRRRGQGGRTGYRPREPSPLRRQGQSGRTTGGPVTLRRRGQGGKSQESSGRDPVHPRWDWELGHCDVDRFWSRTLRCSRPRGHGLLWALGGVVGRVGTGSRGPYPPPTGATPHPSTGLRTGTGPPVASGPRELRRTWRTRGVLGSGPGRP